MDLTFIFIFSGVAIALLLVAKRIEMEHKRTFFLLRAISRGDTRVRELSQRSAHMYSEAKEKLLFFLKKQVPLHSKNTWNKSVSYIKDWGGEYYLKIRNSRVIGGEKEGISEFFKSISDKENEVLINEEARLNDEVGQDSQRIEERVK